MFMDEIMTASVLLVLFLAKDVYSCSGRCLKER